MPTTPQPESTSPCSPVDIQEEVGPAGGKGVSGEWENLEAKDWLGAHGLFYWPHGFEPWQQHHPGEGQVQQGLCPERTPAANNRSLPEGVEGLGGRVMMQRALRDSAEKG